MMVTSVGTFLMPENEQTEALCKLISLIARSLVDSPDAVYVAPIVTSRERTIIQVTVCNADVGQIVGKNGRMAEAIRRYIKAYEEQHGGRFGFSVKSS